ncbi:MAG: Hpt domain-containing protein, partial [Nitrospira sp.]|nr:Hpt domain-containing protein [Nitrospira sp.]
CLFKPVHLRDFERILRRWVGFAPKGMDASSSKTHTPADWTGIQSVATRESGTGHQERPSPRYQADRERYDLSAALQALEGDEELLYSLFHIFNATGSDLINGMYQTIHLQNRQELQRLAHQMKGALSAVHAMHERKKAEELELTAVSATFSHLDSTVIELERMVKQLICEFDRLIALQGK